jgi:hypothetical protein
MRTGDACPALAPPMVPFSLLARALLLYNVRVVPP